MMTPNKREALLQARKLIENGESRCICLALDWVAVDNPRLARAVLSLQKYIMRQLDGHCTLDSWLRIRSWHPVTYTRAKTARLAWIDWMLGTDPK